MPETAWTHAGFKIRIEQDLDATSPRERDNLGTLACWNRKYELGDKEHLTREEIERGRLVGTLLVLPVYLFDHSGLRMSCRPFHCPWDSGQVGYIYVRKAKGLAEFDSEEEVKACLRGEIEVMDRWLSGGFCGFVIEDEDGEHIDSCWGIDDPEYAREAANESAEWHAKDRRERLENAWGGGMSGPPL